MARLSGLQELLDKLAELPAQERNDFYLVHGNDIARMKEFDRSGKDPDGPPEGFPALSGIMADFANTPITAADRQAKADAEAARRAEAQGRRYEVADWRTNARYEGASIEQIKAVGTALLRGDKHGAFTFETDANRDGFVDIVAPMAGGKRKAGVPYDDDIGHVVAGGAAHSEAEPMPDEQANREFMREMAEFRSANGMR